MLDFHKLKNQDLWLVILVGLLSIVGLATLFSTTFYQNLTASNDFKQQLVFFLVGILVYLAVTALDSTFLNQPKIQIILVVLTTISLIAVLIVGDRINGTRRWFEVAGVSIQPSEFAKLVVILSTAATFASLHQITVEAPLNIYQQVKKRQWKDLIHNTYLRRFIFNAIGVIVMVGLIRSQPSLGNALLTFGLWVLMLITMVSNPLSLYAYVFIFGLGLNLMFNFIDLTSFYNQIGFSFRAGRIDLLILVASIIIVLILIKILELRFILIAVIVAAGRAAPLSID